MINIVNDCGAVVQECVIWSVSGGPMRGWIPDKDSRENMRALRGNCRENPGEGYRITEVRLIWWKGGTFQPVVCTPMMFWVVAELSLRRRLILREGMTACTGNILLDEMLFVTLTLPALVAVATGTELTLALHETRRFRGVAAGTRYVLVTMTGVH